jgi:hypothetical protein
MFANESFSVSVWVQVGDDVNEYRPYVYFGRDQSYSGNSEFIIAKCRSGIYDGRIYAGVSRHGAYMSESWSLATGAELVGTGWLHLVGVVDYPQQQVRLYINGDLQTPSDDLITFDMTGGRAVY